MQGANSPTLILAFVFLDFSLLLLFACVLLVTAHNCNVHNPTYIRPQPLAPTFPHSPGPVCTDRGVPAADGEASSGGFVCACVCDCVRDLDRLRFRPFCLFSPSALALLCLGSITGGAVGLPRRLGFSCMCVARVPVAPAVGAVPLCVWLVPRWHRVRCDVLVRCMCCGLAGKLPFVARVSLLACVGGLAFIVCVLVTSTRLHAQKHLWHERGESSPPAAQEDAQQHTPRTLKTLQNKSRVSRTERVLTKRAKTGTRKQQQAGKHPARDPPGTAPLCTGQTQPRRARARVCAFAFGGFPL